MPRKTGQQSNELIINDNISGSQIRLFYRMPTTDEMIKYTNGMVVRKGKKLVNQQGEMRMKYGKKILTGIGEGDFLRKNGAGWEAYSSDEESDCYADNWKDLICDGAPDLVEALGIHVFEGSAEYADSDGEIEEDVDQD